jgi:predicted ABC-type transport system involved in lysophospholipase L1 biosynthesis ATPase subunit
MSDATDVLVEATGLTKAYRIGDRRLEVLRGVDLRVARGEFLALRGASGAGKSTLLHLLGGLDVPDAGRIVFRGETLTGRGLSALARFRNRRVGFIFQAYHLMTDLTALENVALPARVARMGASEARERAANLLGRVGLGDRTGHRPNQLSGGEQQRVAIARCLVNRPELILADEPTGNLDSHTGDGVLELLLELRAESGTTLVIATHDSRVSGRAGRELRMLDGRLAGGEEGQREEGRGKRAT